MMPVSLQLAATMFGKVPGGQIRALSTLPDQMDQGGNRNSQEQEQMYEP